MMSKRIASSLPGVFVALLLLAGACIPEPLEVRGIPVVKPEIVVSSQIIPDQAVAILLTKTFGALDANDDSDPEELLDQIAVNDATVTIKSGTLTDTLTFLGYGLYASADVLLQAGRSYILEVESATLGKVRAETTALPEVSFESIRAELYFDGFDDTLAQVDYSFIDPPGKNHYMINAVKIKQEDLLRNVLNPRDFTRLLKEEEFSGTLYSETFRVFPGRFTAGDTLAVYLSNISEDYYNFMKLRLDNRFSFVAYLSEPANYPSNVEGGKGYFNLYIPDIRFFVLEE